RHRRGCPTGPPARTPPPAEPPPAASTRARRAWLADSSRSPVRHGRTPTAYGVPAGAPDTSTRRPRSLTWRTGLAWPARRQTADIDLGEGRDDPARRDATAGRHVGAGLGRFLALRRSAAAPPAGHPAAPAADGGLVGCRPAHRGRAPSRPGAPRRPVPAERHALAAAGVAVPGARAAAVSRGTPAAPGFG